MSVFQGRKEPVVEEKSNFPKSEKDFDEGLEGVAGSHLCSDLLVVDVLITLVRGVERNSR